MAERDPLVVDAPHDDDVRPGHRRRVPLPVLVAYFIVMLLHGFVFYSVFWRIVPYVRYWLKTSNNIATCAAQGYLMVCYMAPIITGPLSDTRCTRYAIIVASSIAFALHYGVQILCSTYWDSIDESYHIYIIVVLLLISASGVGISRAALFPFGLEQLEDDKDSIVRTSFVRWAIWTYEVGRLVAYYVIQNGIDSHGEHVTGIHNYSVLTASIVLVVVFAACRPWCKLNSLNGSMTLGHISRAVRRNFGCSVSGDDEELSIMSVPDLPEDLYRYEKVLLRKNIFLCMIFFMFGSYSCSYFMANIIFPFQTDKPNYNGPRYLTATSSSVALLAIPLFDLFVRCSKRCHSSRANFVMIGVGMFLAALSIAVSSWDGESENVGTVIQRYSQYVLSCLGEVCYFCAGYEMAYRESSAFLRGTTTGLFVGLGSFFGAIIFFIWYFIQPQGLTKVTWMWAQIMVAGILCFTLFLGYVPLVIFYLRAKDEGRRLRQVTEDEHRDASVNYDTLM